MKIEKSKNSTRYVEIIIKMIISNVYKINNYITIEFLFP